MKMPQSRSGIDLLPNIADTRNRRFEQRELSDFVRILRGIGVRHHQADVMTNEIDLLKAKAFYEFVHITGYRLLIVTRRRPRRLAEAAHIRRDDCVILSEFVEKRNPHVRGIAEAVNQYERLLPGSCLQVMN